MKVQEDIEARLRLVNFCFLVEHACSPHKIKILHNFTSSSKVQYSSFVVFNIKV